MPGTPPTYSPYGPPPEAPKSRRTLWIVLAIVLGVIVLGCGGCVGLAVYGANQAGTSLSEIVTEAALDFSDAPEVDDPSSCSITGPSDIGPGYDVEIEVTNTSGVTSHYRLDFTVLDLDGEVEARGSGIISDVGPGSTVGDQPFEPVEGDAPWTEVTCLVTATYRLDA